MRQYFIALCTYLTTFEMLVLMYVIYFYFYNLTKYFNI